MSDVFDKVVTEKINKVIADCKKYLEGKGFIVLKTEDYISLQREIQELQKQIKHQASSNGQPIVTSSSTIINHVEIEDSYQKKLEEIMRSKYNTNDYKAYDKALCDKLIEARQKNIPPDYDKIKRELLERKFYDSQSKSFELSEKEKELNFLEFAARICREEESYWRFLS